ncbi:hypothetical protein BGX38DRAFT_510662 [Terfezia claveryi]|nr:hypothetical protein BGX38DRAFT_510662 [Terfezia claveryi]
MVYDIVFLPQTFPISFFVLKWRSQEHLPTRDGVLRDLSYGCPLGILLVGGQIDLSPG